MIQKTQLCKINQSPKYLKLVKISLLFLFVLSGCAKTEKEPTNLEKFLTNYALAYPEGYLFENGYYNLLSYKRNHSDKSTIFSVENYNISGEFSLRYETTPFYQFSLNNMKLKRYLAFNAGANSPNEQHEDILWDGENLYNKYSYNGYTPTSEEVWVQKTYGTDQVDNVFIKSRISNIDGVITDVKALIEMDKYYLFIKHADFFDNTLTVYYSNIIFNKTITINFDEDMKLTRFQFVFNSTPLYLDDDNNDFVQVLRPISEIDLDVPTEYEEDFIVESNILEFNL